jgi:guanine deaminase
MDQNAPSALCRGPELDEEDQKYLIQKWHRKSKYCSFAINPRFAISCSEKLMRSLGDLKEKFPDAFVQTHFAENLDEIAAVKALFPGEKNYLSVYDKFGLLSSDTLLGHGIHPNGDELELLAKRKAAIVHCPSSNNFLGSGFCKVPSLLNSKQRVCLGSDIGGGTSFSMFAAMREAYYIQKQSASYLTPSTLLHLATHAGSEILNRNSADSCFTPGLPADFFVVKWRNSELLSQRLENATNDNDRLFATIILGDDRIIDATYVGGKKVYNQSIQ